MNQQIQLLKQQAGIDYNPDQEGLDLFAELIIKECVLISRTSTSGFSAGDRMKEHFGVKE